MTSTQLISASGYDTSRMIFSEAQEGKIADTPISYRRINIQTQNDDGSVGELIIPTEEIYSYGVNISTSLDTKQANGFVMPLCLYNKVSPTEAEKQFVQTFENIVERCKDYLVENKKKLKLYQLEKSQLYRFNPIYYKRHEGEIVDGATPTLYAKLIVSKKQNNKIISVFVNADTGEEIDPLSILEKHCHARAAIKIESIFIGTKISLQVKLYEAVVKVINHGMKRLLSRPESDSRVESSSNSMPLRLNDGDKNRNEDDDDDDSRSIEAPPAKATSSRQQDDDDDDNDDDDNAPAEDSIKTVVTKPKAPARKLTSVKPKAK